MLINQFPARRRIRRTDYTFIYDGGTRMSWDIFGAITAIATATSGIYLMRDFYRRERDCDPIFRARIVKREHGCLLVGVDIHPSPRHVVIQRISTTAAGVNRPTHKQDEIGATFLEPAHEHGPFLDVDLDLLPSSLSTGSRSMVISILLHESQSSFSIFFHSRRSRWTHRDKITLDAAMKMD